MAEDYRSRQERRQKLESQAKEKKNKKRKAGFWKKLLISLVILGIIGVTAGTITVFAIINNAPELNPEALQTPQASILLDMNGEEFGTLYDQNRIKMDIKDIPDTIVNAFIATEDARFEEHFGVDILGIGRAVLANFKEGFGAEGASTITQQVVKNTMLTNEKRLERKIKEAYLAVQLEQRYSKDQIMGMYLNTIYFGNRAYGVATAVETYFGLEPEEIDKISIDQAALLAAIVKAPTHYDPYAHPEEALKRRNLVLSLMNQNGYLSDEKMKEAQAIPIEETVVELSATTKQYQDFIASVIEEVMKLGNFEDRNEIYTSGLTIHTTLDPSKQEVVEEVLKPENKYGIKYPDEYFQPGIVLVDPKTGAIRAIGSGQESNDFSSFYATDIKRQPGSAIKPILDYAPAIEYLKWPTYMQVDNSKLVIDNHQIRNWSTKFNQYKTVSMRYALEQSLNIPAVRTFMEVGKDNAVEFATAIGMPEDDPYYPTSAIGGFEKGVSPLQMAGAYAAFANQGIYHKPHTVTKVVFSDGKVINNDIDAQPVMEDYTAYMITDMLKDVVTQGTGTGARISGLPLAAKTGTTNYSSDELEKYGFPENATKDSWMAGYTTQYSLAIWTGKENKDGKPQYLNPYKTGERMDEDGIAIQLFKTIMQEIHKGIDTPDFKKPGSVVDVPIEKDTGLLASEFTPKDQIKYELAVKGTTLPDVSDKYLKVDPPKQFEAVYDEEKNEITLSWKYNNDNDNDQKVQFKVFVSIDNGDNQELVTTNDQLISITEPIPGASYQFRVITVMPEIKKESEPTTTEVKIPELEEPDFPDGFENDNGNNSETENRNNENNENNENDGNNGNGNNNGNNEDNRGNEDNDEEDLTDFLEDLS